MFFCVAAALRSCFVLIHLVVASAWSISPAQREKSDEKFRKLKNSNEVVPGAFLCPSG